MARAIGGEFRQCWNDVRLPPIVTRGDERILGKIGFMIGYSHMTTGIRLFYVHFFMGPDMDLGGSGKKDPKWLYEDGVAYVPEETWGKR